MCYIATIGNGHNCIAIKENRLLYIHSKVDSGIGVSRVSPQLDQLTDEAQTETDAP